MTKNKATMDEERLSNSFREGFEEGLRGLTEDQKWNIKVTLVNPLTTEAQTLVDKDVGTEQAVDVVKQYLEDIGGNGLVITIKSLDLSGGIGSDDDGIIEGEIVEDELEPSTEQSSS